MKRAEAMAKIAELHTAWSLRYGDEVPYVAADEGAKPTDLAIWQADRSATAAQQDELNATIVAILADIDDTPEPTPAGNMRIIRIMGRPAGGLPFNIDVTQIDLSAVQAAWERQLSRVLDAWVSITGDQRRRIIEQVRAAVNADDLNAIAKISVSSTEAADLLTKAMNEMALIASQHMVTELNDQGLHAHPVANGDLHHAYAGAMATLLAAGYANSASREALRRYSPSASGDDVANAVGDHLDSLSDAFLRQNLGLALTAAQNDGRFQTIKAAPEVALYASEVMDKNTCGPCRAVNGKWLGNNTQMDMVYATYPNGGYTECLGGPRCRGTVVAVYRPRQVDTNHPGPGEGGPQP